jgi:hypothetical protein
MEHVSGMQRSCKTIKSEYSIPGLLNSLRTQIFL